MILPRLNLLLFPSVLALASPVWAEAQQASAKPTPHRPLNLSLPRDLPYSAEATQIDETVRRNLRAPAPDQGGTQAPARLPYGAGYEHRHQALGGAAAGGGTGANSGASAGRRGR
ncbi:MAG: hypothetical protein ACM3KD_03215 [Hyphomicrobiaceae bacterium]